MRDRPRLCARPGCGGPAAATLLYQYSTRSVWIENLDEEPDLNTYDLCSRHAERIVVPVGWVLEDRRTPIIPLRPQLAV